MVLSLSRAFRLLVVGVSAVLAVVALGSSGPASATTSLTDEVTVVMVVPAGATKDATTLQQVVDTVNGPVADYWNRQSGGEIRLGVTKQVDWIQAANPCSSPYTLMTEIEQQVNWPYDLGQHLMLYVPANSGCSRLWSEYAGLHQPAEFWVSGLSAGVIAHGIGMNEGFPRADALHCNGAGDAGTCYGTNNGDDYDLMGAVQDNLGSLSALDLAAAGLLPAGQQQTVVGSDASTTITLSPVSGATGIRGVQLIGPNGRVYWIEYRPASGQDAWLGGPTDPNHLQPGVLVRMIDVGGLSALLDGMPGSTPLPIGMSLGLDDGYFTVSVTAAAATATIRVVPNSPITAAYAAAGGAAGSLGAPTAPETCTPPDYPAGDYCSRTYQHGNLYWSKATGAHAITPPILGVWTAAGGRGGALGLPLQEAACGLANGVCRQQFERGLVYSFPATGTHVVSGFIATAYAQAGGDAGVLGFPTGDATCGLTNGGCSQAFQGGTIYLSNRQSPRVAHPLTGAIRDTWIAQGSENGPLGYPTGDQTCGLAGGGCKQAFEGGGIYSSPATGARAVQGMVNTAYAAAGGEGGALGYPTSGLICGLSAGGCGQLFQGGRIYATLATGTHAVSGGTVTAWLAQGAEAGALGYPTGDQVCGPASGGCKQQFQGGTLYFSPSTGARVVSGAFASVYAAAGGDGGALGLPTSGLICGLSSGGCGQVFQGGRIYSTPATGAHEIDGDVFAAWAAQGYEAGPLGYPTTGLICGLKSGGCGQVFQGGRIYTTSATGAHPLSGAVLSAWIGQGGEAGPLGYPTTGLICGLKSGGCGQVFQGGRIYSTPATGTWVVSGDVAAAYAAAGVEGGPLGYPTTGLICGLKSGGCGQVFQGGRIYTTSATGAHALSGAILTAWIGQGGEAGALGYPTGDQVCGLAAGGCKQPFQGGTIWWSPASGAQAVSGNVAAAYAAAGTEGGALGYPTSGLICGLKSGGCGQLFQRGRIYATSATGAHALTGPIQDAWIAQGGEAGPLGYPTSDARPVGATDTVQDFQGGTLTLNGATGQVTLS